MAQYRNAVMTQNGAALLNKAQAGLCKIKFTRMSTGDGQYSESEKGIEELRKITSLKSHKQSFAFDSIKYQDDTSVELKASITNHDDTQTLSAGYYIREIAVFAQEDDKSDTEVLYSIAVADVADFLPTYNGNNPILIIQKYYVTVDESRSAITVPSHYGEDLDAVKEELEKEWKEYAKNIDEEMKKRPEKDGKADEMTVTFTEAANRENIVTGEKASTLMGKIKKWLADLAAAAFMQVVTSYSDLMAGTALDDYLIGAAAAKEGFTELNGKLQMKIEQKTGEYKNQKLNKPVTICSVTVTPGLWLIIGFIDCNISSDITYNNTIFGQTVRASMIGGGGSTNVMLRAVDTITNVDLSTYDFANVSSDTTYRGVLTAVCLKSYL